MDRPPTTPSETGPAGERPMTADESSRLEALARETDPGAEIAVVDELPSTGLLSFYDRLRARVLRAVEKRGHKLGREATEVLLLVPDVFIFLLRLALDREVPGGTRALVASALAYFVLPVDLLPETLLGVGGYVDDVVLALAVLGHAFGDDLKPWADKHWSGSRDLQRVVRDVLQSARALVGNSTYARLSRILGAKGIDLDAQTGRQ